MDSSNSGIWQPIVVLWVVIFGAIGLALLIGAVLMATRLGWSLRLLSLVGAPVGITAYWFLIRPPEETETWKQSLPALLMAAAVIATVLNLVFGVSPVYAVFTLSAAAGLCGLTYLRFLGVLRLVKALTDLIEDEDDGDDSGPPE